MNKRIEIQNLIDDIESHDVGEVDYLVYRDPISICSTDRIQHNIRFEAQGFSRNFSTEDEVIIYLEGVLAGLNC